MSGQMIVRPSASDLAAAAQAATQGTDPGRGLPPVHLWNPPYCGEIDIRIARDGTWFHEGTPIGRPALVRLFAGILKREGDRHYLVTPVEKVGITVDDAPFVATDFHVTGQAEGQSVTFVTSIGDEATAGPDHALRVPRDPVSGEPAPYIHIRAGLEALIDRKSFYRMVDLCSHHRHEGADWFGLWSGGVFFPVIPSADLP